MDSRTGKKIHLSRLFREESGRTLIVAYSHGVLMGPGLGMRSLAEMRRVGQSLSQADGLMVSPGLVTQMEDLFLGRSRPSLLIHFDYQNFSRSLLPYVEGTVVELAQVEDVVAAGADAIMTYLYIGFADPEREKQEIARNARTARACERWGLPMMIEPRSAREATHPTDKTDPDVLALYCRISAEIGADLVKCIHPGSREAIAQITEGCPAPILIAGGSKLERPEQAYERARSAIAGGAAGLVYGRNIYERQDPAAEVDQYLRIVHGEGQRKSR